MKNDGEDDEDNIEIISTHDEKSKIVGEILGNDTSRRILNFLNISSEKTLNEIAQETGLSLSLVSHHIKRMQSVQVVRISKIGRSVKGHKMNYYSATNQSFLITPSQEPIHSVRSSLKKFSKFVAIGMAGAASWIALRPENGAQFQRNPKEDQMFSEGTFSGTPDIQDDGKDKWESAYQSEIDEDRDLLADFTDSKDRQEVVDETEADIDYQDMSDRQSGHDLEPVPETASEPAGELQIGRVTSETTSHPAPQSSESVPKIQPDQSGADDFESSHGLTASIEDTVRENTGSVSLDSETYPVPHQIDPPLGGFEIDPVFLSVVIPIAIVISGIVLERVLTRWYGKRKAEN